MPIDVVDAGEIAALLGVSRQRVHQLRQEHPDFPCPVIERARAIFWQRTQIERWAKRYGYLGKED
jgi:predicted DNA-binding transcriptional regulator AlpA